MASCTRASAGTFLSSAFRIGSTGSYGKALSLPSSPALKSLQVSVKQSKLKPLCNCAAESHPLSSAIDLLPGQAFLSPSFSIKRATSLCHAVEGNSTTSSSTSSNSTATDGDPSVPDKEQEADYVAEYEEPDSVGKALSQIRQERLVSGEESPSKTEDFWRGVLEEIQLIEWPSLQKVLGTTGVVTGIIIGSSLVLLTVNALLAQLSDVLFKNVPPA